jgi:hypothetical protein
VTSQAASEAALVARASGVIAAILLLASGGLAAVGLLQASGLGLLAALATSIASVAGHPGRALRWIGPIVIGATMVTVVIAGFVAR